MFALPLLSLTSYIEHLQNNKSLFIQYETMIQKLFKYFKKKYENGMGVNNIFSKNNCAIFIRDIP